MPKNWEARDKKLDKRKNGMRVDNRSIFVLQESQRKRDKKLRDERNGKMKMTYASTT